MYGEIVPFFNVVAYYQIGYRIAGWVLRLFYKVAVEQEDPSAFKALPRDAVLVYLMNHRSNADYVLVSYALAGQVAISYAVGEWARAFPLEHIFKAFGSYFVRRNTASRSTTRCSSDTSSSSRVRASRRESFSRADSPRRQARPPKIGLLDYVLGIGRDPAYRSRIHIVPVAVNYDRVLEDRSLIRELGSGEGRGRPSRMAQSARCPLSVVESRALDAADGSDMDARRSGRSADRRRAWFAAKCGLIDLRETGPARARARPV